MPLVNVFMPIVAAIVQASPSSVPDPAVLMRAVLSRPASPLRELLLPQIVAVEAEPNASIAQDGDEN